MWVRHIEGHSIGRVALVILRPTDSKPEVGESPRIPPSVVGVTGADFVIEGVSAGANRVFGVPAAEVRGRRFVDLLALGDATDCVAAWEEACESRTGVAVSVDIADAPESIASTRYELLLFPLEPAPSCAFVLMPSASDATAPRRTRRAAELAPMLMQLAWDAESNNVTGSSFSGLSETHLPGIDRLTTREREITGRLIDGDRVPAIAGDLHLSQSTIRNHLTSVFGKFGVASQQELVDSFKSATLDRL